MNGPEDPESTDAPRAVAPLSPAIDEEAIYAELERRVRLAPSPVAAGSWRRDRLRAAPIDLVRPVPVREFFGIDRSGRHSGAAKTVTGSSQNWSGAIVGIPDGWSCLALEAQWRIPTARPGVPQGATGERWQGSCWIGLDGDLPGSVTLPQLGSTHYAHRVDGQVVSTADLWWQWWIADQPNNAPVKIPIPAEPGDQILARLTVSSPTSVHFLIRNVTTNLAASFDVLAPSLPNCAPVPVEQQTMEFIVERQRAIGGADLLPFADYGECRFEHCSAAMLGPAGEALEVDFANPLSLQIQDWADPSGQGAIISGYAGGDADTVCVQYES